MAEPPIAGPWTQAGERPLRSYSGAMRTRIERVVVRKCEDLQIDEEELRDVRFVGDSLALSQLSRISDFSRLNPRRDMITSSAT